MQNAKILVNCFSFDVNGVLLDDTLQFLTVLNMMFRRLDSETIPPEILRQIFRQPWTQIFRAKGITKEKASDADLYKLYNEIYGNFSPPSLAAGAVKTLQMLKTRGFKLAIVSTQQKELSEKLLNAHENITNLFDDFWYGIGNKTQALKEVIAKYGATAYVGDQVDDILAAGEARAIPVAYANGLHPVAMLKTALCFDPRFQVKTFPELLSLPFVSPKEAR